MKTDFLSYISLDSIHVLEGRNKREVLEEIITHASLLCQHIERDQLSEVVWKRENMMTTAIGAGLALPHVRIHGFGEPIILVGVCKNEVEDYKSINDEMVRMMVFIAASDEEQDNYLKLLSSISSKLKDPEVIEEIIACKGNAKKILRILKRKKKKS
jgi:PTS system nitrogen regulatory IIA component